jgi:hypothetical protein
VELPFKNIAGYLLSKVAFTAWAQRRDAKLLTPKMQCWLNSGGNRTDTETGDDTKTRIHPWTDIHSFYALMGGFAFSTHDLPPGKKFLPGNRDVVILQLSGVKYVAEHEPSIIPDLSTEEILDKSKASGFDKTIVCTQATWFLTQLITRICQGLPISLLELNTAAHALCALLIYTLWWDKPMRIEQPTLISGESMQAVCAALCHNIGLDGTCRMAWLSSLPTDREWERPRITLLPCALEAYPIPAEGSIEPDKVYRLYDGQCLGRFQCGFLSQYEKRPFLQRLYLEYTSRDAQRWRLESKWLDLSRRRCYAGVEDRSPDWPSALSFDLLWDSFEGDLDYGEDTMAIFIGFSAAGILYGGLHLLAWTAPFHSRTHAVLWRVAAVNLAASGVYCVAIWAHSVIQAYIYKMRRLGRYEFFWVANGIAIASVVFFGVIPFYLFSRAFLVVECFMSLAHLPPEVFQQPEWSSYFPHIS